MASRTTDVLVIGAGAAGLMCAITAAQRGRRVQVLDRANKPGKKILMSGGGRCNFTNLDVGPEHFLSRNPHFCKSALSRYTQWDFIARVAEAGIAYHEKSDGQLFCDHSSKDILNLLLSDAEAAGVCLQLNTEVEVVLARDGGWQVATESGDWRCESLVIATGGPSIPTLGASDWGQRQAARLGHSVVPYRASLVPYTAGPEDKAAWSALPGVALPVTLTVASRAWTGDALFTHRGLSGPAVLQITNYWQHGESVTVDWWPGGDLVSAWQAQREAAGGQKWPGWLAEVLPRRVVAWLLAGQPLAESTLGDSRRREVEALAERVHRFDFRPSGTEGYRTAEVTIGGVETDEVSSRTFESRLHPGLYLIGEVLDVTGHLGGYNFQWAWSSGHAAGEVV